MVQPSQGSTEEEGLRFWVLQLLWRGKGGWRARVVKPP